MVMKKSLIMVCCLLIIMACDSTKSLRPTIDYKTTLIGTWEYIETWNLEGEIITSYDMKIGDLSMEIMTNGPMIMLFPDKTYKMIFTLENTDTGYWSFNNKTKKSNMIC